MTTPRLSWDWGTAYDLFVSLDVLHRPAEFGVRGAWTAGVRARLTPTARETLQQSRLLGHVPLHWVHTLPEPKDGMTVLWTLGQTEPAERLSLLALSPGKPPDEVKAVLRSVSAQGAWSQADQRALRAAYEPEKQQEGSSAPGKLATMLEWWSHPEEFGERYLEALRAYYEVFFAEEEGRIRPALQEALSRAQDMAGRLKLLDLLEELSQGLRFDGLPEVDELVLAPSYWTTPLMYFGRVSAGREIRLFGARPPDASLVPGEMVPETMLRALKALSDPTRLRMLRYLTAERLTPAVLSRRLRLRAPTVTHHLKVLRLAGLVQVTLAEGRGATRYAARPEAVTATGDALEAFLGKGRKEDSGGSATR